MPNTCKRNGCVTWMRETCLRVRHERRETTLTFIARDSSSWMSRYSVMGICFWRSSMTSCSNTEQKIAAVCERLALSPVVLLQLSEGNPTLSYPIIDICANSRNSECRTLAAVCWHPSQFLGWVEPDMRQNLYGTTTAKIIIQCKIGTVENWLLKGWHKNKNEFALFKF